MRDVIVIGAGGGGPVWAKELAAKGLDVLVIEAGPRFGEPERQWSLLENDANNVITGYFRAGGEDRSTSPYLREYPYSGFVFDIQAVGGTTLHYFGNYPRAYQGVFAGYSGPDAGLYNRRTVFPFAYRDLIPYYEWVETLLPVATAAVGRKEERWLQTCENYGLSLLRQKDVPPGAWYRPQENAVLVPGGSAGRVTNPAFPEATGCTLCGHCWQGCRAPHGAPRNLFARRSTDNSYIPMALTADAWSPGGRPIELLTGCHVVRIHTDRNWGDPRAKAVTWKAPDGSLQSEDAKVIVLAAGIVESPRLYLNSDLPNPSDWVGRGLSDHYPDAVIGILDDDIGASRGVGSATRIDYPGHGCIEQFQVGPAIQAFNYGFSDSGYTGFQGENRVLPGYGAQVGRVVGNDLVDLISKPDNALFALILTDDDTEPQNRVRQSQFYGVDEHGVVPRIEMNGRGRSTRTVRNREFLVQRAVEFMRTAGAQTILRMDWPPLIFHPHSSMRMGTEPARSVCDEWGQVRAVRNLFVGDNSVLANSLGGPNPTLTTQALGTRNAEHVFQTVFDGEPWVADGDPVTSIDDRVTAAVVARGL